jgi:hypothetical protein
MLVALVAFQVYAATDRHAMVVLVEGEEASRGTAADAEERGPLALRSGLPVGVRLEAVRWRIGRGDAIERLSSRVAILDEDGERAGAETISPSHPHYGWGFRLRQGGGAGHAFVVDVAAPAAPAARFVLHLPLPARRDVAGYRDFELPGLDGLVRAKYHVDPAAFPDGDVSLTLRLVRGGAIAGEASLPRRGPVALGDATVALVDVRRWSGVVLGAGLGVAAVLAGFCLMILGAALLYATPPSELVVAPRPDGGVRVGLRAFGRRDRSAGELERIARRLAAGKERP